MRDANEDSISKFLSPGNWSRKFLPTIVLQSLFLKHFLTVTQNRNVFYVTAQDTHHHHHYYTHIHFSCFPWKKTFMENTDPYYYRMMHSQFFFLFISILLINKKMLSVAPKGVS